MIYSSPISQECGLPVSANVQFICLPLSAGLIVHDMCCVDLIYRAVDAVVNDGNAVFGPEHGHDDGVWHPSGLKLGNTPTTSGFR